MGVFTGIVNVLLILNALVLIVSVLMQEGSRQGLGTIAGGAETFFGKTKGRSYEGKLVMITKISVTTFIIMAVFMTAVNSRTGVSNINPELTGGPAVEDIVKMDKIQSGTDNYDLTIPEEAAAVADETVEAAADTEAAAEATVADAANEVAEVADEAAADATAAVEDTTAEVQETVEDVVAPVADAAETVDETIEPAA